LAEKCKHHEICGRDALPGTEDGLCILHSTDQEKDKEAFRQALEKHTTVSCDFRYIVFPISKKMFSSLKHIFLKKSLL
jgi:hypothetical protein